MRSSVSSCELAGDVCPSHSSHSSPSYRAPKKSHPDLTVVSPLPTSRRSRKTTTTAVSHQFPTPAPQKVIRMSPMSMVKHALLAALVVIALSNWGAEARYLPTRSQDDRLERLRELIKDLLDTELEKPSNQNELFERKLVYKREAGAVDGPASAAAAAAAVGAGERHVAASHQRSQ